VTTYHQSWAPRRASSRREISPAKRAKRPSSTPQDGLAARRLLLVGLGDKSSFGLDDLRRAAATAAKRARSLKLADAAFVLPTSEGSAARVAAAEVAAEGAALGLYRFDRHKTGEESPELGSFTLVHGGGGAEEGAGTGTKIAAGAILARDLANEPSNTATPEYLAERAREISDRYDMALTILDRAAIEAEGLNGLATVGRSASNEPRFIVLEHRRGGEAAPVVLVGKAVTFDSGGISIKPSAGMEDMKYDMSGGAAVLGAMESVAPSTSRSTSWRSCRRPKNLPGGNASSPATCSSCTPAKRWRSSPPTPRGV
jgi:leucyl aminopeptidase